MTIPLRRYVPPLEEREPLGVFVLTEDGLTYYAPASSGIPPQAPFVSIPVPVSQAWAECGVPIGPEDVEPLYRAAVIRHERARHVARLHERAAVGSAWHLRGEALTGKHVAFDFVATVGAWRDDLYVRLDVQAGPKFFTSRAQPGAIHPVPVAWLLEHGTRIEWSSPVWGPNTPDNFCAREEAWDETRGLYACRVEGMDAPTGWEPPPPAAPAGRAGDEHQD